MSLEAVLLLVSTYVGQVTAHARAACEVSVCKQIAVSLFAEDSSLIEIMTETKESEVVKALNVLAESNLRSVDHERVLRELVTEYFCERQSDDDDSVDSDTDEDESEQQFGRDVEPLSIAEQSDVTSDVAEDACNTRQCSVTEAEELLRPAVAEFVNEDNEAELEMIKRFKCNCKLSGGQPCHTQFTPEEILRRRLEMQDMTSGVYYFFSNCRQLFVLHRNMKFT